MHQKGQLKTKVLEKLLPGTAYIPTLVEELSHTEKVTPQSIYTVLRAMKEEETISVHKKHASLSLIWIAKEIEKLSFSERAYRGNLYLDKLSKKRKGKEIFMFKTINELDLFWTHSYTILLQHNTKYDAQYLITPHDFFLYGREVTDTFWIEKNLRDKNTTRLVITHAEPLDMAVMKARRKNLGNIFEFLLHENPLHQESHTYYNLVGSYIFKATFDKRVNEKLETFITKVKKLPLAKDEEKEIRDILTMKGRFTLTVEKHERKAKSMENKLKKYFE